MIHYRRILELHNGGISLRGIAASTGNSRPKVTEVISMADKKGLVCPTLTNANLGEVEYRFFSTFTYPYLSAFTFHT